MYLYLLLLGQEEVGRSEDFHLTTFAQVQCCGIQQCRYTGGSWRSDAQKLQGPYHAVGDKTADVGHAEARWREGSVEWFIPSDFVLGMHVGVGIEVIQDFETSLLQAVDDVLRSGKGWQTVTYFNTFLDADVILVLRIVLLRDHPIVAGEKSSRLQDTVNSLEGDDAIRRVASCLNFKCDIEGFVFPRQFLEVSLVRLAQVRQTIVGVIFVSNFDLVVVDGDTIDLASGKDSHVSHWATNTTSDVKSSHAVLHAQTQGQVVLCTLDGFQESFVMESWAEVE